MVAAPLCKPYGAVTPLVLRVWMGASSVAVCQSNCTVTLHPVPSNATRDVSIRAVAGSDTHGKEYPLLGRALAELCRPR